MDSHSIVQGGGNKTDNAPSTTKLSLALCSKNSFNLEKARPENHRGHHMQGGFVNIGNAKSCGWENLPS